MLYAYLLCARIYSGLAESWFVYIGCFFSCLIDNANLDADRILLDFLKFIMIVIISLVIKC